MLFFCSLECPAVGTKNFFVISSCINTPTLSRNRGGGVGATGVIRPAQGTRGETGRLFFFKVVLNFVVSPSLQVKKWEKFWCPFSRS